MEKYLENVGLFSSQEIEEFLSFGKDRILEKGDFFIRQGDVADKMAFVKSGILRSFYYSSSSEDVTYCFSFPQELIAGYSSFITGEKTNENIQALSACELIVFPKRIIDEFVRSNSTWLLFTKNIAESQYVKLEKRIFTLQKENAKNRYLELLEKQPDYIQKIPLGYLASYLGISQRHLSRLRKQMCF